jgi:hypothetical protein
MPVPPFPPTPWLWLLGGAVALIVSLIALLVASAPQRPHPHRRDAAHFNG